jgi:exodeoxyribonuclease VII large subunit
VVNPRVRLTQQAARVHAAEQRLARAWHHGQNQRRARLGPLVRTLNAVSPLATLERGYAIVSRDDGVILRDAAEAAPGSIIDVRLEHGRLRAKVEGSR